MKKLLLRLMPFVALVMAAALILPATVASAGNGSGGLTDIVVPTDTVVEGVHGDVVFLASQNVPSGFQGGHCAVEITPMNNESHREGTDIIVSSGSSSLTESNIESWDYVHSDPRVMVLGETITVSVRLGEHPQPGDPNHGAFSGGVTVSFSDCHAPPVDIRVCRGGVSQDIPQDQFNPDTDTMGDCPAQCEHSSNFPPRADCPTEPPVQLVTPPPPATKPVPVPVPVKATPRTTG